MPPVELMPVALTRFMLDEAGGSWMECVLVAALIAKVCTLMVLATQQHL
jgi:Flp pilus assembly pilin Flp